MTLTQLVTENWAWLTALALVAAYLWRRRDRGPRTANGGGLGDRADQADSHPGDAAMAASGAAQPMLTPVDSPVPGSEHHTPNAGRQRHGCC